MQLLFSLLTKPCSAGARRPAPLVMIGALMMMSGMSARAATLTVSNLADSGAGSLRAQVAAAASGDTITFGVTGVIELNSPSIAIAKDLTITGPGAGNLTLSGNGPGGGRSVSDFGNSASVFSISSGVVGISGLRISDGSGTERLGGGIRMSGGSVTLANLILAENYGDSGGGVYMTGGTMTIDGCTFSGNNALSEGGAIAMKGGAMTLLNSTLSGNNNFTQSAAEGGAINLRGGNLSINRTSISSNRGSMGGGIFQNDGTLEIANSTISGNTANESFVGGVEGTINGWGGGIFNGRGPVSIINSTISGNRANASESQPSAAGGGAMWTQGGLTLANSTVVGNFCRKNTGGIYDRSGAGARISNTILAGNTTNSFDPAENPDLFGEAVGDYNLVQNMLNPARDFTGGTHNIFGKAAQLGPLADNGGPTLTHAPLAGSPVLDAGDPGFDVAGLPFDQRGAGNLRQKGIRIDIGAVEGVESQSGNNFVVNSLEDGDDGVCGLTTDCTLREAVGLVPTGGSISFSVTGVITLTLGEIRIFRDVSIIGPTNAPGITLSGGNASRIFALGPEKNATGGLINPANPISPSTVNFSNLTLRDGNGIGSTLSSNGGALFIDSSPTPTPIQVGVTNCTFSGNSAPSVAGATISGNGGAIRNAGTLTVTNSTFSGNSAGTSGGAIRSGTTLTVTSSTFVDNSAGTGRGGGIDNNNSTLNLSNSIVAGNSAPTGPDIGGVVNSASYNFVAKGDGSTGPAVSPATTPATFTPTPLVNGTNGNQVGSSAAPLNPMLGALADNGGPTPTMALLEGSSAINRGINALVPDGVTTDQRTIGFARIHDGVVDIGAFEVQPIPPRISLAPTSPQNEGDSGTTPCIFTVTRSGDTAGASTVAYSVGGGSATAGSDYGSATDSDGGSPGILFFGAGQSSASISVPVVGDQGLERDETFTITLSDPTDAALGTTAEVGTIRNDDSGLVVTTLADAEPNGNDQDNTLREAITSANRAASGTEPSISFASNVRGEILLSTVLPSLTKSMALTGPGASLLTVRPATEFAFVVFTNESGVSTTLSGLTISRGFRGVVNSGALTMLGCVVTANRATDNTPNQIPTPFFGGGIQSNGGSLTMMGCTVSNNTVTDTQFDSALGGGIYAGAGAVVNLTNCTVSGNTVTPGRSSASAGRGAGIYIGGTATILNVFNCTVSGNTATTNGVAAAQGGGIHHDSGTVTLVNCSVAGNTAQNGGGGLYGRGNGTFNVGNTVVAGNTSAANPDAFGTFASQGYNLIGNSSGATLSGTTTGNQLDVNPMLGALDNNGGPTQTFALLEGSAAINAGNNALIPSGVTTDQRGTGFARISGGVVDIGAFEVQQPNTAPVFGNSSYQFVFTLNRPISGAKVSATDAEGDALTYSLSGGALPNGITFNINGSFSGTPSATSSAITRTVTVNDGTTTATASVTLGVSSGDGAIISEFRFRGVATGDQYVELYNTTGAPLNISGWSIRTDTGGGITQNATVPAGSIVPAYGHFLFTGTGYSLTGYSASDASLGAIAANDSGVALFNAVGEVQDAAGFADSLSTLREGAGLASAPNSNGTATSQSAFMRRFKGQLPVDTGDNAADFLLLTTDGLAVAGTSIAPQLGAPNPEGLTSPVNINAQIGVRVLDANFGPNVSPNRVRNGSGNGGSLVFRRYLKNNTGQPLSRIRLLITDITGQVSPVVAGQADVRLTSQGDENVAVAGQGTVLVYGTTLEAPSTLPNGTSLSTVGGGGIGSSVNYDIVMTTPLQPNEERAYGFNVQVAKTGSFFVNINLLGK